MAQEAAPAEGETPEAQTEETTPDNDGQRAESGKTFSEDYVKTLRAENADRRTNERKLSERIEELEAKDQSELEKAQSKATKAEQRAATAESQLTRYQVASEKQVPADALDLLNGTTREELEASADKILNLVKNRSETESKPDFDGGAREPASEQDPEKAHNRDVLRMLGIST